MRDCLKKRTEEEVMSKSHDDISGVLSIKVSDFLNWVSSEKLSLFAELRALILFDIVDSIAILSKVNIRKINEFIMNFCRGRIIMNLYW